MKKSPKVGLEGLLRPKDSILVLIDHQPYQFTNLNSHEPTVIINNVIGLAKTAKVFNVPTILTSVIEERGGYIIKGLLDVYPEQKPVNRTLINAWEETASASICRHRALQRWCRIKIKSLHAIKTQPVCLPGL